MKRTRLYFLALGFLILASTIIILYARGLRLDFRKKKIQKTGMILVRSKPKGAKVYLEDELKGATDAALSSLKLGEYKVRLEKEGFAPWERRVPVEEEMVTEVEAFLVSHSPTLTPLTKEGVLEATVSPQGGKIAYMVPKKGIYVLDLSPPPILGMVRENPRLWLSHTKEAPVSKIVWGPKGGKLLVTLEGKTLLVSGNSPQEVEKPKELLEEWEKEEKEEKQTLAQKAGLSEELQEVAQDAAWSPKRTKFLAKKNSGYYVYNLKKPLGVGEEKRYLALEVEKKIPIFWFDEEHIVLVENDKISLLEIQGTNKTEIYKGKLAKKEVFPAPSGKIIILASFRSGPPNLYALGLQ